MKLIKPSVELIKQESGIKGMLKHIELAGRVCYKSEDKITDDSASHFIDGLIKSGHTSVLEHGTVNLTIPGNWNTYNENNDPSYKAFIDTILDDPYSRCIIVNGYIHATTNYRRFLDLRDRGYDYSPYMWNETENFPKRHTFRIICDRGVANEIVRHRVFSFAQESTRYCNYSKDKFGNELTFIIPSWSKLAECSVIVDNLMSLDNLNRVSKEAETNWIQSLMSDEVNYLHMLEVGYTPQQARQVLPLALKTEIVVTGFEDDWKHFLSLRSPKAGAKGMHPDMAVIADKIYDILTTNGYISL